MGVFPQTALAQKPKNLSFEEAATLTCSGLTAWNALMEAPSGRFQPGDVVLVQGTGGVSIAALQIAVAAGATVIATTSSDEKASRLKTLGASHVINYRKTPQGGQVARSFTPDNRGVDHVVDTGGYATLHESMVATRINGLVTLAGGSGGFEAKAPDIFEVLLYGINFRGVLVGTQQMMRAMVKFFEETGVKPALDDVVFGLEDVKGAYERLDQKKHYSKIVIKM